MAKILIIEDQGLLREEVCDWFRFEGFEVQSAGNGREGLEKALSDLPDIILCDIMMPELDGNQVLLELRRHPSAKMIPFIFMTALADRSHTRNGMASGADDYITKPFTREELLRAVDIRICKAKEQRVQSDQTLNELRDNIIGGLPHELRTPLNSIMGFSQLMMDEDFHHDAKEVRKMSQHIFRSSSRLLRLIENYLLYAQLELKKKGQIFEGKLINPVKTIKGIAGKIAVDYHGQDSVFFSLEDGLVNISELEFSKIIEELTDNAFKFSSPGSHIRFIGFQEKDFYYLTIEDKGCGISMEDLKKVGAYMQFERKLKEQQGSGLGLTIAMRLAELFDGTLSIDSIRGTGTKIHLRLPSVLKTPVNSVTDPVDLVH